MTFFNLNIFLHLFIPVVAKLLFLPDYYQCLKKFLLLNIFVKTVMNCNSTMFSKRNTKNNKKSTFIQQVCIQVTVKSDSKDIYDVTKDSYFK